MEVILREFASGGYTKTHVLVLRAHSQLESQKLDKIGDCGPADVPVQGVIKLSGDLMEHYIELKRVQPYVERMQKETAGNFEQAWKEMEKLGYNYGADALESVKFGWEMRGARADLLLQRIRGEAVAGQHEKYGELDARLERILEIVNTALLQR